VSQSGIQRASLTFISPEGMKLVEKYAAKWLRGPKDAMDGRSETGSD